MTPPLPAYGGLKWGYNKPGCMLWGRVFPTGRLYIQADMKFQQQPVEAVVAAIMARTEALGIAKLTAVYADPEMFDLTRTDRAKPTVESLAVTFQRFGLFLTPSPAEELQGWQRVQDYLRPAPDRRPWLIVSPQAKALVRTIPTLVQDDHDPDTCTGQTYAADALRFLVASRPLPGQVRHPAPVYGFGSLGWLKGLDKPPRGDFGLHR